jgi:MoaA/NifB/PqqE/SkfB family radical SAM enzyme
MSYIKKLKALWGMEYRSGSRNKFGFRPRAAMNILKFMAQRPFHPVRLMYKPITLMIEVSTVCNLKCPACEREMFKKQGLIPKGQVGLDNMERLRPILPYVHSIYFVGGLGEPFLNPLFWDMVGVAKEYKVTTGYFSNAVLWDENIIRKTFESGINTVLVSVDSQDPKKYEFFKEGASFAKTIENIRLMSKIRREYPKANFKLGLNYVQRSDNFEDMPDYIDFADDLGADYSFFTGLIVHEEEFIKASPYLIDASRRKAVHELVRKKAEERNMQVRLPAVDISRDNARTCTSAWRCLYVFENGDVCLCPFFRTPRDFFFHVNNGHVVQYKRSMNDTVIGNLNEEKVGDIWNGDKAMKMRRAIKTGENVPNPCDTCYYKYDIH